MFVITKKDICFTIFIAIICISGAVFSIAQGSKENNILKKVVSENIVDVDLSKFKVVIDAGHGNPDGGAVSDDGVEEANLNLQIAKKLQNILIDEGIEIIMTRSDENNIADLDKQTPIRKMKVSDINNRIKIVNESGADFLISIHLNKYSDSRCSGWQTFYNKNSENGKVLAELIQESIKNSVQRENKRNALKIENVKLIEKAQIPAVIVECGFISNPEENKLLQEEEYQEKLAEGIFEGIKKYCNTLK